MSTRGVLTLAVLAMLVAGAARAAVTNTGAAVVAFPFIDVDTTHGADTFIHLTNIGNDTISVRCFYENTTAHCAESVQTCQVDADCGPGIACQKGWVPSEFQVQLIKQQPVGWRASQGLPPLLPGAGTIPSVPENPFVGALRCVVVNQNGTATASNVLIGHATIERNRTDEPANFEVAKYNAVGVQAVGGDVDGDGRLLLGGAAAEYQGCANVLLLDHFFDQAIEPVRHASSVQTVLALLSCSADYVNGVPGKSTIALSTTNELDTTVTVDQAFDVTGQFLVPLDAAVFQVGTQGTLTGATRLSATGAGVIATAFELHHDLDDSAIQKSTARSVPGRGTRAAEDAIVISATTPAATPTPSTVPTPTPTATARGDLNHDGSVNNLDLGLLIAELYDGDGAAAADAGGGTVHTGPEADVNGDAMITAADLAALVSFTR